MPVYLRSEERTVTSEGEVIAAMASHTQERKQPKRHGHPRRFWGNNVATWFDAAQDDDESRVLAHITADAVGYLSLKGQPVVAIVTTPAGVHEAAEEAGWGVNPYELAARDGTRRLRWGHEKDVVEAVAALAEDDQPLPQSEPGDAAPEQQVGADLVESPVQDGHGNLVVVGSLLTCLCTCTPLTDQREAS